MEEKKFIKFTAVIILLLIFVIAFFGASFNDVSAADNHGKIKSVGRTLKVAYPITQGISEIDENGKHKGIFVDFLNEISKYTDWRYEYVKVNASEMLENFKNGEYDLMGGTYYLKELEEWIAYSQYPMGNARATLLCLKDNTEIKSYNINSLNGKTIGVYAPAAEKIRRLKIYLESNNLDCEIKYYTAEDRKLHGSLYYFLRNGDVDVLLGNENDIKDDFALFSYFNDQPYYIVTHTGYDEILSDLNYALQKILDVNPNFAEEAYARNSVDIATAHIRLNEAEQKYVESRAPIKVSVMSRWHPFYCIGDKSLSHIGLVPDILDRVSKFSGLDFEYVFVNSYNEMLTALSEGKADISGFFSEDEEHALERGFARTEIYATLNNTIVKNKSVNFPNDELIGGITRGRKMDSGLTKKEPVLFDSAKEGLEAVQKGEIDFFSDFSSIIEAQFQRGKYPNVVFVSSVSAPKNISFSIKRPVDTELYSILNKSIRSISTQDKINITNKNIASEGTVVSMTLADLIAANPFAFAAIIFAIFAVLAGGAILLVRFRMGSRIMKAELDKAEARSRAKSDFLSRMSHEIRTPMNAIVGLTDIVSADGKLSVTTRDKIEKIRVSSNYMLSLINDILDMSRIENDKLTLRSEYFSLGEMLEEIGKLIEVLSSRKGVVYNFMQDITHDSVKSDHLRLRQVLVNLISNAVKFTPQGKRVVLSVIELSSDNENASYEFSVTDEGVGIVEDDMERIFKAFEQSGTNMAKSEGTGLGLAISSSIVRLMGGELSVNSEQGKGSVFSFVISLPLGKDALATKISEVSEFCLRGLRALLVEDNDINAEIASELLGMYGAQTDRAENGQIAVDLFTASESGHYDVILMDLKMPVMDGLEATREIRLSVHPDATSIPIVAMTANSFVEDRRAADEVGMNGFVPKPVNMEQLISTVRDLTGK